MIISGCDGNLKINLLAKQVSDLILSGVNTDKILILCLNSYKKEKILSQINDILFANKSCGYSQINISTFSGIVYNSVQRNWVNIEKILSEKNGKTLIYPTLSGLDIAQYFFRNIIKEEDFKDYFSKKNLMHQLLRRYKLIVENSLSEKEIIQKSQIIGESFAANAASAINNYKIRSSQNRIFDNLKQISSFMFLLKKGLIKDFNKIEYFFADDVDEYNFAAFEFCKFMIENTQSNIYLDKNGCSRKGYLCAYTNVYKDLVNEFKPTEKMLAFKPKLLEDAENLAQNIVSNKKLRLNNFEIHSFSKRLEMVEAATQKILELLAKGVNISKIQIITPLIDENLIYSLNEFFKSKNIKLQLLTGNSKITEDLYVYATITILELLNPHWGMKPNSFDVRILLNEILGLPIFECQQFIVDYEKNGFLLNKSDTEYLAYNNLIDLLNNEKLKSESILTQFEKIFAVLIAPNMKFNADFEPINLFLKSINEFEKIKENFREYYQITLTPKDWLLHIKSSIVSQNPSKPAHIDENALILSTAQKIVDFSLESDYQIWLDITSSEWIKEDTGTIYNSWVFQKNFNEIKYTTELNKKLTLEKAASLLRKLMLCAKEKIIAYSSVYDVSGRENYGELANFVLLEEQMGKKFEFTPRDDQKEILKYKAGKLAVPAVPGAGKTTVMLALLFELIQNGVNPSEILVLTYMESAARNFLNKFKKITSARINLPQISTIHAFAYKILMENNNYALVNLPEDFSICDDALKTAILKEICAFNLPIGENLEEWASLVLSAISKVKMNGLEDKIFNNKFKRDIFLQDFILVYTKYKQKLKEKALLDYDDLLIYAISLLLNNSDVANYYQEKFKFIIEDEAQDSSIIQQKFISILSGKYNNIIRCGDVNQAILGTFSNSDVNGFKKFIKDNKKIEMFRSQRCSKNIYELANSLISYTKKIHFMKDAFYDLKMQEVKGKNPISADRISYYEVAEPIDEKEMILNDIKTKLSVGEKLPSIAILLRTNKQVSIWANFIEKQGTKVLCRGDSYRQKKVFNFILCAMELFLRPWDNKIVAKFYKEFCSIDYYKFDKNFHDFIEKSENIFLNPSYFKNSIFRNNKDAENFWWEAFSIVESRTLDIQEIVIACATRYFTDIVDKSNAYLFSVLIKRYTNTLISDDKFCLNYIPDMIKYFKNLFSQNTLKGINLFAKEDEDEDLKGFVQIMTIHKAKGAEFDYVYLPEFTDFNYTLNFSQSASRIQKRKKSLLSKLDKLLYGKEPVVSQIAKEEIEETLRLIYVAITRAKKGLKFSYSKKNEFKRNNLPVNIIKELIENNEDK